MPILAQPNRELESKMALNILPAAGSGLGRGAGLDQQTGMLEPRATPTSLAD
ncbi:hypothetical protein [Acaryochloris marina]|uniref:hypothetical protein n=1 Tax=Acaryochloris marina TaxID=155978 RepID=UPI001BAF8B10|nr:hypothetical protein [Acaryochloris marina]QUY41803.1 hypothetical protein I1H34_21625 [Acaryochloris marina S15]